MIGDEFDKNIHNRRDGFRKSGEPTESTSINKEKSGTEIEQKRDKSVCFDQNTNYTVIEHDKVMKDGTGKGIYYTTEKESLVVHLKTKMGVQIEIHNVPKTFYAGDIVVIIVRDTKIRHDMFELYYKTDTISPLQNLSELADSGGIVSLSLELLAPEDDGPKLRLGNREIELKSGLAFHIKGVKKFVGNEPGSQNNVLILPASKGDTAKQVDITWLSPSHHKPFLGGYRNTLSNERLLNASAQTSVLRKSNANKESVVMYSRDAQTYKMRHFGQNTLNEMSTQFSKPGFLVANYKDKLRTPGKYETSDEYLERILKQIITIQKYIRRWLAKRRVEELRRMRNAYLQAQKDHEESLRAKKEAITAKDQDRQLNPKKLKDFDRIFYVLEQWRQEELRKISTQNLTPAERKAALALLLNQETEILAAISQRQVCLSVENKKKGQANILAKAAAPLRWTSSINSRPLQMDTTNTVRGKELFDLFESLRMDNLSPDDRLDLLITLKKEVVQHVQEYKVCREIVQLVDREAELIVCGLSQEQLTSLRHRILNRFVVYAKIPQINPEVAKYLRVPTGTKEEIREKLHGDLYYCISCDRYLKTSAFPLSARATWLTPCKSCRRVDNWARKRADVEPYQRILSQLREYETELIEKAKVLADRDAIEVELAHLERGERPPQTTDLDTDGTDFRVLNSNPCPFLLDEADIQFIVDEIWERQSVLSGWLDINDLVLVRWQLNEPWSPWNTILVTREEAVAHAEVDKYGLEDSYADAMLKIVTQRLVMGRNSFPRLQHNALRMAYQQVRTAQRMKNREETIGWLRERRQLLPPLQEHRVLKPEEQHKPIYQPPVHQWPAIRGEKRWSELQEP